MLIRKSSFFTIVHLGNTSILVECLYLTCVSLMTQVKAKHDLLKVSEYDHAIQQSHTADQPTAPRGSAKGHQLS